MRLLIVVAVILVFFGHQVAAFTPHAVTIRTRIWKVAWQYDGDVYLAFERGAMACCDAGKPVEVHIGEIEKEDLGRIRVPKVGDRVWVRGMLVRDYTHALWVLHPIYAVECELCR